MPCIRTLCDHAISSGGRVVGCGFYPTLMDLPDDCQIPEIEEQDIKERPIMDNAMDEIILLTEEMLINK